MGLYYALACVYDVHSCRESIFLRGDSSFIQESAKPGWKLCLKKVIARFLFTRVSGFFAVGQENADFYKFYGAKEKKIFLTPYAVENERYIECYNRLGVDKNRIRKEIGILSDKTVILFSSKLIERKRPMDILRAYEDLKMDDIALVYIGDGHLMASLEMNAKTKGLKNVYFRGFINQMEISKYYAMADIFVLPSDDEPWGLVVNEAMCFHLPVIVSDRVGCYKDLVKHGENGFVFKAGNIAELSGYLKKLILDSELRRSMGAKSFDIIKGWDYKADVRGILSALEAK